VALIMMYASYISNDFGISFSNNGSVNTETIMSSTMKQDGTALMSDFVTVLSTTKLYTLNGTGTSFVFTFITKNSGGKGRSAVTTNLAGLFFFCNDNLASYKIGSNTGNVGFPLNCEGLVLHTTSIYLR
jgi:tetrahydromethanopterin S-methyltransferase subunit D